MSNMQRTKGKAGDPAAKLARETTRAKRERLESALALALRASYLCGGMVRQYRAISDRRYAWDFAWPDKRLLVEVQGGLWVRGAHSRPLGIQRDMDKLNIATLAGWRVLQVSAADIKSGAAVQCIGQALAA